MRVSCRSFEVFSRRFTQKNADQETTLKERKNLTAFPDLRFSA
jgi:hypothetical protein